jgi:hypothetical protein
MLVDDIIKPTVLNPLKYTANGRELDFVLVPFVDSLCPLWLILYHKGHKGHTKSTKGKRLFVPVYGRKGVRR